MTQVKNTGKQTAVKQVSKWDENGEFVTIEGWSYLNSQKYGAVAEPKIDKNGVYYIEIRIPFTPACPEVLNKITGNRYD